MNGHILDGMPIAVDCFTHAAITRAKLFFLTHMHSDHTVGLSSKWNRTIYCSQMTARLLNHKFNIPQRYIEVLEPSQPHLLLCNGMRLTVHMFEANHCVGSCTFIFEFENRKILYTGDFRFDDGIPDDLKHTCGRLHPIDVLYLDNTYCEPLCCFPKRSEAIEMIIDICHKHPEHRIFIGTSWVGHENLLVQLSLELKEYVFVGDNVFDKIQLLEISDVFRRGTSARLNALPNDRVTCNTINKFSEEMPTIGIKPTAMYGGQCKRLEESNGCLYVVPYSNHCNYDELIEFVKMVRPGHVKPIVPGRKTKPGMESVFRADMHQFEQYLTVIERDFSTPAVSPSVPDPNRESFSESDSPPNFHKGKLKRKFARSYNKPKPCQRGVQFNNEVEELMSSKSAKVLESEKIQKEIEEEILNSPELLELFSSLT